ncbi:MAG: LexA repressor [Phycisphaerae bacterium]|nr:LexA repressor [Phycisphaerae bacterium]
MPRHSSAHERRRLTPRQLQIMTLLRDYQNENGYSPTMQEIADHLGVSKVTVFEHVETLIAKGLLRRLPHKARSLELTSHVEFPDEKNTVFPIRGYIAAGRPIEAVEQDETIELLDMFQSRHPTFILKVRGDSMIDDQIRDGDYVICEQRRDARSGETVVALLEGGEATLKRYYREGHKVRLQPANSNYEPIILDRVEIQGVVRGVLRSY